MKRIRCKKCNNFFNFTTMDDTICDICKKKELDEINFIRAYVRDNYGITISDLVSDTGIPLAKINKYIDSGVLEFKY